MNLSRGAQKLNQFLQSTKTRNPQILSQFLRDSPRHFSTGIDHQPQPQHSWIPSSNSGSVYGRLFGISSNTLKTDIISLLEGCNLTLDDIKVDYNRAYHPMAMLVQFRSTSDFSAAIRELMRKNRSFRLVKEVDNQQWDLVAPYNGRYVLFRGIPRNANLDDVERFLSGCDYDSSSLELFVRGPQFAPERMAKVGFPSQVEAMNAVIRKNGAFCLNSRITAQLIQ